MLITQKKKLLTITNMTLNLQKTFNKNLIKTMLTMMKKKMNKNRLF